MSQGYRTASTFFQTVANEATAGGGKDGSFYTDLGHIKRIADMLTFEGEATVFDITSGNCQSLFALADADNHPERKCFACEVQQAVFEKVKDDPRIAGRILNVDSAVNLKMQHNCISLGGINPPYGWNNEDATDRKRWERIFIEKITNYIMFGGILVWIIPQYVLADVGYLTYLAKHYEVQGIWKFDDDVYKYFKQVCVIGKRRNKAILGSGEVQDLLKKCEIENMPYLPQIGETPEEKKFLVPEYKETSITLFQALNYSFSDGMRMVDELCRKQKSGINKACADLLFTKPFGSKSVLVPPIPISKAHQYLLMFSVEQEPKVVGEEDGQPHLTRSLVEIGEDTVVNTTVGSDGVEHSSVTVRSHAQVKTVILEQSGRITEG